MFTSGFLKIAKISDEDKSALKRGALIGAGVGAVKNIGHNAILDARERKAKNARTTSLFKKSLRPGDIIISGTNTRLGESYVTLDLPDKLHGIAKKMGLKDNSKLLNLPNTLTSIGAGTKYHAGVYVGKGRMAHLYPHQGAHTMKLDDALSGENAAAYRLKSNVPGRKKQIKDALGITKKHTKARTPYRSFSGQAKEFFTNVAVPTMPGGLKARANCKDGLVCHSLPAVAYKDQKWSHGANTFSGDLRRNTNFEPVVRKDVVKLPTALKVRSHIASVGKGLKYALPGAAVGYGIHKYKQFKKEKDDV